MAIGYCGEAAPLYIHIPFCISKCAYCGFFSEPLARHDVGRYVKALVREVRSMAARSFGTVYIGGGTPTCMPAGAWEYLLKELHASVSLEDNAEFTVEANPGALDRERLELLFAAGVNRISLGCQSFDDQRLAYLGRIHDAADVGTMVRCLRDTGFENISLDLIYACPGQDLESLDADIDRALALHPEHFSWYELSVEKGTPLAGRRGISDWSCEPELALAMADTIHTRLASAGYQHYEVSSYALPGRRCLHNTAYWQGRDYAAAGAGAVSLKEGRRFRRAHDIQAYIEALEAGEIPPGEEELLDRGACQREMLMMGLRLTDGIRAGDFEARTGVPLIRYAALINSLCERRLMEFDGQRLAATASGMAILDTILVDFFSNID